MLIKCVTAGPVETNAYFVFFENAGEAIVIDAPPESLEPLLALSKEQGTAVKGIYLTHSHFDHIHDAKALSKQLSAPVFVHKDDSQNLEIPGSDGLPNFLSTEGVTPGGFLQEGDAVSVGGATFSVLHTPGHTPGGVCFFFPQERALFSGDTLFQGTHGRVDLPGADKEAMLRSLKRLSQLDGDITVYPGHGASTTIENERRWICR